LSEFLACGFEVIGLRLVEFGFSGFLHTVGKKLGRVICFVGDDFAEMDLNNIGIVSRPNFLWVHLKEFPPV
jgi:hypothetical protein